MSLTIIKKRCRTSTWLRSGHNFTALVWTTWTFRLWCHCVMSAVLHWGVHSYYYWQEWWRRVFKNCFCFRSVDLMLNQTAKCFVWTYMNTVCIHVCPSINLWPCINSSVKHSERGQCLQPHGACLDTYLKRF